jgi:tetratricopeptide (TPR) repeat protein
LVVRRWLLIGLSLAGLAGGAIGVVSLVVTSRGVARDGELAAARRALAAGEHREAARHFDRYRAAAGAAADPDALVERATVLLQIAALADGTPKAVQRAVDAAFEAMRRRPDDLALRRRLADVQMANRDFKGAREHLLVIRESIGAGTSDDDPAAIDLAIARSWLGSGDHRQALDLVARLTGFDVAARSFAEAAPGADASTGAYLLLEEILRDHLDDPKAADAAVERCVQVHPDDPAALLPHARLALSRNDPQTSLRTAARAVALHPADPAAALAHARALSATGDAAASTAAYLEGLRRAPQDRPLFAAAARHVAMSGEPEQVLGMLDGVWERLGSQEEDALVFLATMRLDDSARTTRP